jgi:hypothetical protein
VIGDGCAQCVGTHDVRNALRLGSPGDVRDARLARARRSRQPTLAGRHYNVEVTSAKSYNQAFKLLKRVTRIVDEHVESTSTCGRTPQLSCLRLGPVADNWPCSWMWPRTDWSWAITARRKVMGKPHARTGPPPPADHGVRPLVQSATKVEHRAIWLIFDLLRMLSPSRGEVVPWLSGTSFGGDRLFARASFISRRFINSSYKVGLRIGGRASKTCDARETGPFFMATKGLYHRPANLTKCSTDRRVPTHGRMADECLLAWRIVNIVSPKLVGCSSSLSQLRPIMWSSLHRRDGETCRTVLAEWANAG